MTVNEAPIGIFDSGIGGLTVLDKIRNVLPSENIVYVADSLYAPYGDNPPEFILSRSLRCAEFLADNKVKCLVIASNTATACAAHELRNRYSLPVIATEPPVKPAIETIGSSIIGVLVTAATSSSHKYERLLNRVAADKKVITQPCPGLVKQIETQGPGGEQTIELLRQYLKPLMDENIDTLVLGCTHYPYLTEQIREIVGPGVTLVDPSLGVARHVRRCLDEVGMLNNSQTAGRLRFWTSGSGGDFVSAVTRTRYPFGFSREECVPYISGKIKSALEFHPVDPALFADAADQGDLLMLSE